MKSEQLSDYFEGIASKRLSAVETDPRTSHQHELNGVSRLREIFGSERTTLAARFIFLSSDEDNDIVEYGNVTWYDARENNPDRTEYRLYYDFSLFQEVASGGDFLLVGKLTDQSVIFVVAQEGSSAERHVQWLFGIANEDTDGLLFEILDQTNQGSQQLDITTRKILSEIGIEVDYSDQSYLEDMLRAFPAGFPTTRRFSEYARQTLAEVSSLANPDKALVSWMDREELLFKTLEKYIVGTRLDDGFDSVEDFIAYSLSVQNRRKSRAGYAFENHVEQLLLDYSISFSRGKVTENKSTPDFVFPGIKQYHDPSFPSHRLSMLGVKSTLKERWRQVLAEARRIEEKHLLTLEAPITETQTDEMSANKLRLVIPSSLHERGFSPQQQTWLLNVEDFLMLLKERVDND